jgi:hypothetical protein
LASIIKYREGTSDAKASALCFSAACQPAKLRRRERAGTVCFERQAFQCGARQIFPSRFKSLCDVFRQL